MRLLLSLLLLAASLTLTHAVVPRRNPKGEPPVPDNGGDGGGGGKVGGEPDNQPQTNPNAGRDDQTTSKDIEENLADVLEKVVDAINSLVGGDSSSSSTHPAIPFNAAQITPAPGGGGGSSGNDQQGCVSALSLYSSCAATGVLSDYYSIPQSDQASCLCYTTTLTAPSAVHPSWIPDTLDGYMTSCNRYVQSSYSAAATGDSNSIVRAGVSMGMGMCHSLGNALAVSPASASTTTAGGLGGGASVSAARARGEGGWWLRWWAAAGMAAIIGWAGL